MPLRIRAKVATIIVADLTRVIFENLNKINKIEAKYIIVMLERQDYTFHHINSACITFVRENATGWLWKIAHISRNRYALFTFSGVFTVYSVNRILAKMNNV